MQVDSLTQNSTGSDSLTAIKADIDALNLNIGNVKTYGAVGDGATDDTTAIQAALDDVAATGGSVYFPEGTYKLTATLTIADKKIKLYGAGMDFTKLKWSGVDMTGENGITYTNAVAQEPFVVEKMSLICVPDAGSPTVFGGIGISATYPNQQTVMSPTVMLTEVFLGTDYTGYTWSPTLIGGWTTCVNLQDAGIVHITRCNMTCGSTVNVPYGIKFNSASGNPDYVVITNCSFFGFFQAIWTGGTASLGGFIFSCCEFVSCHIGIDITLPSDLVQVSDCYFSTYYLGVFSLARTTKISGSRFDLGDDPLGRYSVSTAVGIILGNGLASLDGSTISDCNFGGYKTGTKYGILVDNGISKSVICGNTFGAISAYGTAYAFGVVLVAGSTGIIVHGNVNANTNTLCSDSGTTNIVKDNTPEGAMAITGATPALLSGTGGTTLDRMVYLTQGGATNVTNFTNGYVGQEIIIIAGDGNSTIISGATIRLSAAGNFAMGGNATLHLFFEGAMWREIGRGT